MNEWLQLEVVEGPSRGTQVTLDRPLLVGRDPQADLVLEDRQASRRHARIAPSHGGAIVDDLDSSNGTFVRGIELHGPTTISPGDELMLGVSVLALRTPGEVAAQPSAVRAQPPPLAAEVRQPDYVPTEALASEGPETDLERLVDLRTRAQARTAPVAIFVLFALALIIYFATR